MEQLVQQSTKLPWSVCHTKRHYRPFKRSITSNTSNLNIITFGNSDLIITLSQVHFCEQFGLPQTIKQMSDQRNRKIVLYHDLAKGLVINTHMQRPFFLLLRQNGRTKLHLKCPNVSSIKQLLELFPKFFQF